MPLKQISEEECWFIIGAHQAGASERQCAELSGISKTVTHNIINNFKKLGSPNPSSLSIQALLKRNNTDTASSKKRKIVEKDEELKIISRKRGRPRKPAEKPYFTQSIVCNALNQARKNKEKVVYNENSHLVYPLDRLHTPPSDEELLQIDLNIGKQSETQLNELPLTPRSNEVIDEDDILEDNNWTMDEDKELLTHVLNLPLNHIKWKDVENKFEERHLAKMCLERWEYVKKQLLKDVDYAVTENNIKEEDDFVL